MTFRRIHARHSADFTILAAGRTAGASTAPASHADSFSGHACSMPGRVSDLHHLVFLALALVLTPPDARPQADKPQAGPPPPPAHLPPSPPTQVAPRCAGT